MQVMFLINSPAAGPVTVSLLLETSGTRNIPSLSQLTLSLHEFSHVFSLSYSGRWEETRNMAVNSQRWWNKKGYFLKNSRGTLLHGLT